RRLTGQRGLIAPSILPDGPDLLSTPPRGGVDVEPALREVTAISNPDPAYPRFYFGSGACVAGEPCPFALRTRLARLEARGLSSNRNADQEEESGRDGTGEPRRAERRIKAFGAVLPPAESRGRRLT